MCWSGGGLGQDDGGEEDAGGETFPLAQEEVTKDGVAATAARRRARRRARGEGRGEGLGGIVNHRSSRREGRDGRRLCRYGKESILK